MSNYEGTRTKRVGIIGISAISPEARELLDKLCAEYKRQRRKDVGKTDGYSALYWACRYSGLIEPAKKKDFQDLKRDAEVLISNATNLRDKINQLGE